jgi:hypothetical protein
MLFTVSLFRKEDDPMKRWLKHVGSFVVQFVLHIALESVILSFVLV